jgi:hypothetical protein
VLIFLYLCIYFFSDAALERKEKKENDAAKLEELEIRKQEDGSVVIKATEKGPKEERVTTVLMRSSRTGSQSQLITKDTTVVTKRKTSEGDEYTEVDNIATSKKLTTRGSLYMNTEVIRSKHLTDSEGHQFIEEEVVSSRMEDSVTQDEAREDLVTTTTQLVLEEEPIVEENVPAVEEAPKVDLSLAAEAPKVKSEVPVSVHPQVVMVEETKDVPVMEDAEEPQTKPEGRRAPLHSFTPSVVSVDFLTEILTKDFKTN